MHRARPSRRVILAALAPLTLSSTWAACGGGEDEPPPPPPAVASVVRPGSGAPPGSAIEVVFTGPLPAGAAWEGALEVRTRQNVVVPGRWALGEDRRRLFFVPGEELQPRSRYGVRVGGKALVRPGQAIPRDETFEFLTGDPPDADVRPVLKNLGVRIAPYDEASKRMGDLLLDRLERKPFLEFGAVVKDPQGKDKVLPDFAFTTVDPAAPLVSPIDGVVSQVYERPDGHRALWLRPSRGSDWLVYLDHVKEIRVAAGDPVMAGQPICKSHDGFFELNVMYDRGSDSRVYAPFVCFDPALAPEAQARIWELMQRAEALAGRSDWYDEQAMRPVFAGCLAHDLAPS